MLSIASCVILTKIVVGLWAVFSGIEWLQNLTLFSRQGLLSWEVVGLRKHLLPARIWNVIAAPWGVQCILAARILAGIGLISPIAIQIELGCAIFVLLSSIYLAQRTLFGGDGSDQMGLVLAIGLLLMLIGKTTGSVDVTTVGAVAIGGQSTIAYFSAGAAKLISPVWRDGSAIRGVMDTQTYGHKSAIRYLDKVSWLGLAVCWTVIITESYFRWCCFCRTNSFSGRSPALVPFIWSMHILWD